MSTETMTAPAEGREDAKAAEAERLAIEFVRLAHVQRPGEASDDVPARRVKATSLAGPLVAALCYLGLWIGIVGMVIAGVRGLLQAMGAF